MALKDGDIVQIDFTAKDKEKQEIFDTTNEQKAIEAGIYNKDFNYQPLTLILGNHEILPELEENLKTMKIGENKNIQINSSKAFGERKAELVRLVPLQEFKNRNIMPVPGLAVSLNDMQGRVQTVSGGRVRVDFNHPLAGKTLEYDIKVVDQITDKNEKMKAIAKKYLPFVNSENVKSGNAEVSIELDGKDFFKSMHGRHHTAVALLKYLDDVKKVKFIDEFKKEDLKNYNKTEEHEHSEEEN
ncbi:MAG: FKBP-type peptidyl-prolyl cis-trans isomerase [Candidatus Diapherotrites archaeon]|nr:FKBP-type peptidyl-prolyl cis-trans isomerase [Candidatus Diapherotrites archaeon]